MKMLIIVLLLIGSTVFASEPIRVIGIGDDIVTARHDAFRKAIEYKIGSMVLSEKDVRSSVTVRNDVLVYSAGYVDDYNVIVGYDGRQITLDVLVSTSRIANRIIDRSNSLHFDGSRHSVQLKTLQEEKELKRRYIDMIMKEFPYHAIHIQNSGYNITENNRGQYIIDVPYTLVWNKGFLEATKEMLDNLKDKAGNLIRIGNANVVYIPRKKTMVIESMMFGNRDHYIFENPEFMRIMRDHMVGDENSAVVRLNFKDDNGNVVHNFCQKIRGRLYNTTDNYQYLVFHEKEKETDSIKVLVDFSLDNISEIDLEIVRFKDCFN